MAIIQRITPFLWFDTQAEEAARFYCSIFKDSEMGQIVRYGDVGPGPKGQVMIVTFKLEGQEFTALNGGPRFQFDEAISFAINCETQEEIDYYWDKLTGGGGQESQCGWLKDKFGLSWQVVPTIISELMTDDDPEKSGRVMQAVLQMKKIDLQKMKDAAAGN
jgi:predicted 3-demethylubiquinone-9 3-methyltransferase (glyoxalase superfamily)